MIVESTIHSNVRRRPLTPRRVALQEHDLFRAGQYVRAGVYREVDGANRTVILHREDYLPASLDGRVACYERLAIDFVADKRY